MKTVVKKTAEVLSRITKHDSLETIMKRFKEHPSECKEPIPHCEQYTKNGQEEIKTFLEEQTKQSFPKLTNGTIFDEHASLKGNIENYIGMTQVPTGVIGPLHIKGTSLNESVYIPLATSEGALVASYHRGAKAVTLSGGVTSVCMNEAVYRSPVFKFLDLPQLFEFLFWFNQNIDKYYEIVGAMSNHAKLEDITTVIEGNSLIISFEYYTGDASGQNMVTFSHKLFVIILCRLPL